MLFIYIISLILYLVAIAIISKNMYYFNKEQKIVFIAIGLIVVFIITVILCNISVSNIELNSIESLVKLKEQSGEINIQKIIAGAKNIALYIIAPINSMVLLTLLARILNKSKEEGTDIKTIKTRMILILILFIIVLILEKRYIYNFVTGMLSNIH